MYWWSSSFRQFSLDSGGIIESVEMSGLVLYLGLHGSGADSYGPCCCRVAGGLRLVCFSRLSGAVHTIAGIWLSMVVVLVCLSPCVIARA